jgi:hypothetical protein
MARSAGWGRVPGRQGAPDGGPGREHGRPGLGTTRLFERDLRLDCVRGLVRHRSLGGGHRFEGNEHPIQLSHHRCGRCPRSALRDDFRPDSSSVVISAANRSAVGPSWAVTAASSLLLRTEPAAVSGLPKARKRAPKAEQKAGAYSANEVAGGHRCGARCRARDRAGSARSASGGHEDDDQPRGDSSLWLAHLKALQG